MSIATFDSQRKFRAWLEQHHRSTAELLVRCYKTHAKDKGLTYRQALDEALCFGWIDGVRRAVDEESFSTRFTPRKPKSKWSAVNIKRATELQAEGRMHPAGEAAFAGREAAGSRRYSYETRPTRLDARSLAKLRANKRAWAFFQSQAPWYRRTSAFWVMEAKRAETRERRLAELIARSAKGEPIKLLDRRPPAAG
ncbi:MAG TPA: YdeI/OmpD-associated family protein [Gemmatimonadales bacterium]|nr:YdeI/OmpD-associated family protein [Gemmatimonadales bacterium]